MVFIHVGKDAFDHGLPEHRRLGSHLEAAAIFVDGRHLLVIEEDNLPVPAHKSLFLLLQIFRIYP